MIAAALGALICIFFVGVFASNEATYGVVVGSHKSSFALDTASIAIDNCTFDKFVSCEVDSRFGQQQRPLCVAALLPQRVVPDDPKAERCDGQPGSQNIKPIRVSRDTPFGFIPIVIGILFGCLFWRGITVAFDPRPRDKIPGGD